MRRKLSARARAVMVALASAVTLWTSLIPASGQRPAIKHYNVEDGLAHATVGAIYQDRQGFLWFGTADGLSRFDGYVFTNYGKDDGLPGAVVTSIAEDTRGRLWVGTTRGLARLIDDPNEISPSQPKSAGNKRKKFIAYQIGATDDSNAVNTILFDQSGALWCTSDEIYRAVPDTEGKLKFEIAITHQGWSSFRALADSRGRLWFGLLRELIEYDHGQIIRYGPADGLPMEESYSRKQPVIFNEQIVGIAEDSQGRIFVANRRHVFNFIPGVQDQKARGQWQKLSFELPMDREIRSLYVDSQLHIWIGTTKGLIRYDGRDNARMMSEPLASAWIFALSQDREGNLWATANEDGVYKSSGDFIVNFTKAEGIPDAPVSMAAGAPGAILLATASSGVVAIRNGRVEPIRSSEPFSATHVIISLNHDSHGNYWVAANDGLYYFPGPELDFRHGKKFGPSDGAALMKEFGIGGYEDPQGRIWCGALNDPSLYLLEPGAGKRPLFKRIPLDKAPSGRTLDVLHCAITDRAGQIWFGWQGELGRYRNAHLELIDPPRGLSEIPARNLFIDSRGWLWIGTAGIGVLMTKDPTAEHPQFVSYSVSNGLINDTLWGIGEDDFGRLYFSTTVGLDRLDVATGRIHHFTMSEGMGGAGAGFTFKDHEGNLWVASGYGVSKLNPRLEPPPGVPPPVHFSHVQIAGEDLSIPERGAERIDDQKLPASRNNLLVEFAAVNFQGEHQLRYQYKLEGVDKDWSAPSEQRLLNFARLAPGSYRLLVRSINSEGSTSDSPSIMEFRILPPVWQRWWFIALAVLAIALSLFLAYRYRIAHLMELERTRLRIARDLHDEIGSGLGSIGILSGLAAEKDLDESERTALASKIATASGELGNTLGEIVWALRQESETLKYLAQHLTERAGRLFPSATPEFKTNFPDSWPEIKLSLPVRRNVQLIAIEALHNAVKHSRAKQVTLGIAPAGRHWRLTVRDDGAGFDERADGLGMGLRNMRQRAADIGANLDLRSGIDKGTKISVVFDPQAEEKA